MGEQNLDKVRRVTHAQRLELEYVHVVRVVGWIPMDGQIWYAQLPRDGLQVSRGRLVVVRLQDVGRHSLRRIDHQVIPVRCIRIARHLQVVHACILTPQADLLVVRHTIGAINEVLRSVVQRQVQIAVHLSKLDLHVVRSATRSLQLEPEPVPVGRGVRIPMDRQVRHAVQAGHKLEVRRARRIVVRLQVIRRHVLGSIDHEVIPVRRIRMPVHMDVILAHRQAGETDPLVVRYRRRRINCRVRPIIQVQCEVQVATRVGKLDLHVVRGPAGQFRLEAEPVLVGRIGSIPVDRQVRLGPQPRHNPKVRGARRVVVRLARILGHGSRRHDH